MKIIVPWIEKHPKGFIIDNLVRGSQLTEFKRYSEEKHLDLDFVINITLPKREIYSRFKTRIAEHKTDHRVRYDETPESLQKRITVYEETINSIEEYFKKKGIYHMVSGNHSVSKVHEDILKIVKVKLNGDY